jgi:pyruvate,orthophosphate dikinase
LGAVPGVAAGRVATTADAAVRLTAAGPVILVRPETSPMDMHGLAAAAGVVTARGGPASHAAVVARSMGKPAVVGVADLAVDGASVRVGGRTIVEGDTIAIDGASGVVVLGEPTVVAGGDDPWVQHLLAWADEVSGGSPADDAARLSAAHAVIVDLDRHGDRRRGSSAG